MQLSFIRRRTVKLLLKILSGIEKDLTNEADLYFCYRLLLGRKPDEPGWQHWSQKIKRGQPRDELVRTFLDSQEFRGKHESGLNTPVELEEFVMYVDPTDPHIGKPIIRHKVYEQHVTIALKKILKEGLVFLDIGANMGWFTLLAATIVREGGKVFAFEPNPSNLQLLYHNIATNGLTNVTVFPYAASNSHKLLQLVSGFSNGFVTALPTDTDHCHYVQAVRVDDLIGDERQIDVIKLDIEGHEPWALRGMRQLIGRHRPLIVSEFSPKAMKEFGQADPEDYLRMFEDCDYDLSVIEHDGNELPLNEAAKIFAYWKDLNQRLDMVDTVHLDILARPRSL